VPRIAAVNRKIFEVVGVVGGQAQMLLHEMMLTQLRSYLADRNLEQAMFSRNVVLSGSAILQLTYGVLWKCSDTDIFCTRECFDETARILVERGYFLTETVRFKYGRGEADDDSPPDIQRAPKCREYPVDTVYKWAGKPHTKLQHFHLDIIIPAPDLMDPVSFVRHFDISACQSFYDGDRFFWSLPCDIFQKKTSLTPLTAALLNGFQEGWQRAATTVDECISKRDFLRSDVWELAVLSALDRANDFYNVVYWNRLKEDVISNIGMRHVNFFHRQITRVIKYVRRNFQFSNCDVHKLMYIAYCLEHVFALPYQRTNTDVERDIDPCI